MLQQTGTLEGKGCKYREFVYRVPVIEPMQFIPEPSIAENYALAIDGYVSKFSYISPKIEEKVDVLFRERETEEDNRRVLHWQLWLIHNQYTLSKIDRLINTKSITIVLPYLFADDKRRLKKEFIQRSLYYELT